MTNQPVPQQPRQHLSPSERQRQGGGGPLEPLERILDKGIVVDAWAEVRVLGLPLASVEARVIVASIETYLYYAQAVMEMPPIARGPLAGPRAMGSTASRAFAEEGLNPVIRQVSGGQSRDTSEPQPADAPPPPPQAQMQAPVDGVVDQFQQAMQQMMQRLDAMERRLPAPPSEREEPEEAEVEEPNRPARRRTPAASERP